jgi:hypothetical protein
MMQARNMPAVDQNQLVRHFLKSHPEVSEILIKEYLVEHPVVANKLLRTFSRRRQGKSKRQRKTQGQQLAGSAVDDDSQKENRLTGVNGTSHTTTGSSTTADNSQDQQQSAENASAAEKEIEEDDDELQSSDGGSAENDDALETIRSVAQEIVRKKQQQRSSYLSNYNDLTLAAQWKPSAKNLDAALSQHRTYLQEVAALDENELFMELIRDVGEWAKHFQQEIIWHLRSLMSVCSKILRTAA